MSLSTPQCEIHRPTGQCWRFVTEVMSSLTTASAGLLLRSRPPTGHSTRPPASHAHPRPLQPSRSSIATGSFEPRRHAPTESFFDRDPLNRASPEHESFFGRDPARLDRDTTLRPSRSSIVVLSTEQPRSRRHAPTESFFDRDPLNRSSRQRLDTWPRVRKAASCNLLLRTSYIRHENLPIVQLAKPLVRRAR